MGSVGQARGMMLSAQRIKRKVVGGQVRVLQHRQHGAEHIASVQGIHSVVSGGKVCYPCLCITGVVMSHWLRGLMIFAVPDVVVFGR